MGIARMAVALFLLAVGGALAVLDAPLAVKEKKAAPQDRKGKDSNGSEPAPPLEPDPDDIQWALAVQK